MKRYRLDNEVVTISSLRFILKNLEGYETAYLSEEDVVRGLQQQGLNVTVNSFCGSTYSALQWGRP